MFSSGKTARQIVDEQGLQQVTDQGEIERVIDEVIAENPKMVEQYLDGKDKLLGFFVGQAMKLTKGKANPKILNERIASIGDNDKSNSYPYHIAFIIFC